MNLSLDGAGLKPIAMLAGLDLLIMEAHYHRFMLQIMPGKNFLSMWMKLGHAVRAHGSQHGNFRMKAFDHAIIPDNAGAYYMSKGRLIS